MLPKHNPHRPHPRSQVKKKKKGKKSFGVTEGMLVEKTAYQRVKNIYKYKLNVGPHIGVNN